jgi:hypothetical protein
VYESSSGLVNPLSFLLFLGDCMRTTKRFTPKVLERFERQGRGSGTYDLYVPWHQVGRGDPASVGRSHLHIWNGRQRHLLSDQELVGLYFIRMLTDVTDCLEQYRLSIEPSNHPLLDYDQGNPLRLFPGTVGLCLQLGVKHPRTSGDGATALWRMSTDFFVVRRGGDGRFNATAVACKQDARLPKRKMNLLEVERAYWECRGIDWLLITPEVFHPAVADNLKTVACWTRHRDTTEQERTFASKLVELNQFRSITELIHLLTKHLGSEPQAQKALWQSVVHGPLSVDLRRPIKFHVPFRLIEREAFLAYNPIEMRRTSWK